MAKVEKKPDLRPDDPAVQSAVLTLKRAMAGAESKRREWLSQADHEEREAKDAPRKRTLFELSKASEEITNNFNHKMKMANFCPLVRTARLRAAELYREAARKPRGRPPNNAVTAFLRELAAAWERHYGAPPPARGKIFFRLAQEAAPKESRRFITDGLCRAALKLK